MSPLGHNPRTIRDIGRVAHQIVERLLVLPQPVPLLLDLSEICFGRLELRRGTKS